jgi:PAS domain-containing protein
MLESELFALLERTSDASFSVSEEGEIMSWNRSAERLFGYSAAEAVHKTCYEILDGMGVLGTRVCLSTVAWPNVPVVKLKFQTLT